MGLCSGATTLTVCLRRQMPAQSSHLRERLSFVCIWTVKICEAYLSPTTAKPVSTRAA